MIGVAAMSKPVRGTGQLSFGVSQQQPGGHQFDQVNATTGFQCRMIVRRVSRDNASGSRSRAPTADRAKTSTGTGTSSTATLMSR